MGHIYKLEFSAAKIGKKQPPEMVAKRAASIRAGKKREREQTIGGGCG
jgi:uncharacterized protein YifN (PemK superfamily)